MRKKNGGINLITVIVVAICAVVSAFLVISFVIKDAIKKESGSDNESGTEKASETAIDRESDSLASGETTGIPETEADSTNPETTGVPTDTTAEVTTQNDVTTPPVVTTTVKVETTIPVTTVPVPVTTVPTQVTTEPVETTTVPSESSSDVPGGETTAPPDATDEPAPVGRPVVTSYPVAASERVDNSFFDDAVFIGDSRTQGLQLYGDLKNATYYAYQGLNVITAQNYNFVNGGLTIVQALAQHQELKKIYICLGVNEYWLGEDTYRANYATLIDSIMNASPNSAIYMYAVTPLFDGLANSAHGLNNEKMARFNQIAKEIAMARGIYYLDAAEPFTKADGRRYLDAGESSDGVHLNGYGISKLTEYFRTHTK